MTAGGELKKRFDPAGFAHYLEELTRRRPAALGHDNLVVLERIPSTNLLARGVAVDYESEGLDLERLLVLAFEQSAGRGREGHAWSSPRGRGVYATLARPLANPELLQALPLLVGVGLCRALAPHLAGGCLLKWPNDLLACAMAAAGPADARERGRKIGGVLIEALVRPGVPVIALIGFGVNHGQLREELPPGGTSLRLTDGRQGSADSSEEGGPRGEPWRGPPTLAELTWELVGGVEHELAHLGDAAYAVAAYRELSIHRPGEPMSVRVGGERYEGSFAGFDEHGLLRLLSGGRELRLAAGEVIEAP